VSGTVLAVYTRASILVGRDEELAALERAMRAARHGSGRGIFLVGESGIGKSRLAAEAESRAYAAGMRLLRGRGSAIGPMVPFRPLAEALLSLRRTDELPEAEELGPYLPVLGRLVPDWSQEPSDPDSHSVVILAEAIIRLTGIIGRDRGCLLVLDDLQDADAETLAVVEYLVDNLDRQPIMLLGALRGGAGASQDLIHAAAQRRSCSLIELHRIGREQMSRLVESCLDAEPGEVPDAVVERLWEDSAGNPFIVEELLNSIVDRRVLVSGSDGWRLAAELRSEMPSTWARSTVRRADELGAQGRQVLSVAALLGRRFPLDVVQAATGLDGRSLLSHLRAGLDAQLVAADEQAPDWYAFQHPLTAEALRADLAPAERVALARQVAEAIETTYPGLPGEWCQVAATLREDAGERSAAGRLFAAAGRRAIAQGAANSAVTLLDRSRELLADDDGETIADVLEVLVQALTEAGLVTRALVLAQALDGANSPVLDSRRRAALHTRIAWAAYVAGRIPEGVAQLAAARELLGPDATAEHLAPVDVVAAYLALEQPGRDRIQLAEALARRTATVAEQIPLPAVACQAWQLVGVLVRSLDLRASTECFERANRIAQEHQLAVWRIYAQVRLGGNDVLYDADLGRLLQARDDAVRTGAVTVAYEAEANLAMQHVLRGEFDGATDGVARCLANARQSNLIDLGQYALLTRAVLAAHRGRRREMDQALREFGAWDGWKSQHIPLAFGLARAFCALLEEDRERAGAELAEAYTWETENPTIFYLTGRYGLRLLLGVLDGTAGCPEYEEVAAASASRLRWNKQFALLAEAVLLGRSRQQSQAQAVFAESQRVAGCYPMAHHLGLRLVAEAALADGWGTPLAWLKQAEAYFYTVGVPAVAGACRSLLRRAGARTMQRRDGAETIPAGLRSMGVTTREHEVLQLLVDRASNRRIADRLHISPRTAEKHVASLITKTGQPDRGALCDAAPVMLETVSEAGPNGRTR
jgi:DNA-binding CsgD family transcriptional regulator